MDHVLTAAETLAEEGISCEVFDPRTLVPFDWEGLGESLTRTGRLVIAHEAPLRGGFGAEIAAWAAQECFGLLKGPIRRIGARNTPIPYAPVLEAEVIPTPERIATEIRIAVG